MTNLAIEMAWLTVIIQNIDNLHQRAGSAKVIELHGYRRYLKSSEI
jgi:NAD-dependent SIR2 family protein deacetylase